MQRRSFTTKPNVSTASMRCKAFQQPSPQVLRVLQNAMVRSAMFPQVGGGPAGSIFFTPIRFHVSRDFRVLSWVNGQQTRQYLVRGGRSKSERIEAGTYFNFSLKRMQPLQNMCNDKQRKPWRRVQQVEMPQVPLSLSFGCARGHNNSTVMNRPIRK